MRALFVCTTIVAAFSVPLAAAPAVVEDVPLSPAVVELALRLEIEPARDGARFMADMARALYSSPDAKGPFFATTGSTTTPSLPSRGVLRVQVPLPATLWATAVFKRALTSEQLVASILADRRASLLCRGLSRVDDATLTYFAAHPGLVTWLYENATPLFAAFGEGLRIDGGRVVVPGGAEAVPLWEAAVAAPVSDPVRFARALFQTSDGRLGYLLATLTAAPPEATRFALGLWIVNPTVRMERFKALVAATQRSFREWHPSEHPFARPLGDLAMLLVRLRVQPSGIPATPSTKVFWGSVLQAAPEPSGRGEGDGSEPIDAAWLLGAIGADDMYARVDRLDQLAFGQRVFTDADQSADGLAAGIISAFRRYRMLLLTLERSGVRRPDVYAQAIQRAQSIADLGGVHRFWTTAQYQGGLALIFRTLRNGGITTARAEALVRGLTALPLVGGEYDGAVAAWLRNDLASDLPKEGTWETRFTSLLAGASIGRELPRLTWEGQDYRLDLANAERQRIDTIRRKQGGHTLDAALVIDAAARSLRTDPSLEDVRSAEQQLRTLLSQSRPDLRDPVVHLMPPGVTAPRDAALWLDDAVGDLAKITKPADTRRAARIGASLQQLADIVLGDALLSFVYAAEMGDPEGPALLAGNVALRHDFGFSRRDGDIRARTLWSQPRQDFQPGTPWHVSGALMGLDVALAPLSMRRLSIDRPATAPRISSIEREGLAMTVVLLDPSRMTDRDRDAIAAAIDHGRQIVSDLVAGRVSAEAIGTRLGLDGNSQRSLSWALTFDRASVPLLFSLADLMLLGGGTDDVDLDAWGAGALASYGCVCTRFSTGPAWRLLEGRNQLALLSGTMNDTTLALALATRELQLPAALVRSILMFGVPDIIDSLADTQGDWWSLSRAAQSLRRQKIEDYVSFTAAVDGPLVPDEDQDGKSVP